MTETIRISGNRSRPSPHRLGDCRCDRHAPVAYRAEGTISPSTRLAAGFRTVCWRSIPVWKQIIAEHQPVEAAAEETFMASNASSALKLGHARAAALLAPARAGLPVAEYAARLVKKSVVGTGGADKNQIAAMISVLLPGCKARDDAADALAVAICHAHHRTGRHRWGVPHDRQAERPHRRYRRERGW